MRHQPQLLLIAMFTLFQIISSPCNSQDNQQLDDLSIDYDCIVKDTVLEIYTRIVHPPIYGSNDKDLSDYIISSMEIVNIEQIVNGEIMFRIIIFETGEPCLTNVFGTNVPKESLQGHESLINDMPHWTPGKARDTPCHAYVLIAVKIINGKIGWIY